MQVVRGAIVNRQVTDAERIAELEKRLAYEKENARIFMEISTSWSSRNTELRRLLRKHGISIPQEPEGL